MWEGRSRFEAECPDPEMPIGEDRSLRPDAGL